MLSADMLERKTGRIELLDVELKTGSDLLFYLYNGRMKPESDVMGLVALADKYDFQDLKKRCEKSLIATVSDDNCVELLTLADLHGCSQLKQAALAYIKVHGAVLVKKPSWDVRTIGWPSMLKELVEVVLS